jgi:ribonuclease P protein component
MKSWRKETRVGITSGKKIGNAVKRNRARRVIRCAFSLYEDRLNGNWDIVFVARTRTSQVKMQEVASQMEKQLIKLGVIDEKAD